MPATAEIAHFTGARPNFPKLGPVFRGLDSLGVSQVLVHTGQHYDDRLSGAFFRDLALPQPDINFEVRSGSHARQTAAVMVRAEEYLEGSRPRLVIVYGDVNSTVAVSLVASKLHIPIAHVEAGLRSFDMTMPEEVNRIVTDRLSTLHFVTSPEAIGNLAREGLPQAGIHFVGNPMIDTLRIALKRLDANESPPQTGTAYAVATLHRPSNVDNADDAVRTVRVMHDVADQIPLRLPLHPRGRASLSQAGLTSHPNLEVLDPLGYLDFLGLMRGARVVITDSGGVQEETTILGIPCLTLRTTTERPITITHGTNRLVKAAELAAVLRDLIASPPESRPPPPLWDGQAGTRIAEVVASWLASPP